MKTPEHIKLEEDLRFQIERMLWITKIDNLKNINSFTVTIQKGAVKSVRVKVEP